MQNRYAGDENDFMKYAVLRRILRTATRHRLGVCWYLTDPSVVDAGNPQNDGDKVNYLLKNQDWRRQVDPELFDRLVAMLVNDGRVEAASRNVANIATARILPNDTLYFSEEVPQDVDERSEWHTRSLATLAKSTIVFLDPDNSVSELYVQGGKWAAPAELRSYWDGSRSVVWISHPRKRRRVTHHARTMATLRKLDSLFCSVYLGHCGFHFMLCQQHESIKTALKELVRDGIKKGWGTCRYFDSLGESINPGNADGTVPAAPAEIDDELVADTPAADTEAGMWEYCEAVVVNDTGALWKKRNPWLDTDDRWDIAFLLLEEQRIQNIQFVPFANPEQRDGVKCFDDPDNHQRWKELSQGTSNSHQVVYRALVRRLA